MTSANNSTFIIPFRRHSSADDYLCEDGELLYATNLVATPYAETSASEIPDTESGEEIAFSSNVSLKVPSVPAVEFSLRRASLPGWNIHPDSLPVKTISIANPSDSAWGKGALETILELYRQASGRNLFTRPFLVVAAFRMNDGLHISPTPPVLMIPNSQAPVAIASGSSETEEMTLSITSAICALQFRLTQLPDQQWEEKIKSLDLFISEPIPLFSDKDTPRSLRREVFSGFSHYQDSEGNAGEFPIWENSIPAGWQPVPVASDSISRMIAAVDSFHLISSIPSSRLNVSNNFSDVSFNCGASPETFPLTPYRPDYLHHSSIEATGAVSFSGRTTLFDLSITPPQPLPLNRLTPFCNQSGYLPRFIFHPDPEALAYSFTVDGKGMALPLMPHPSLNGSYHISPLSGENKEPENPGEYLPGTRRLPNALLRSGRPDSLLYPDSLLEILNIGRIIAVCRAFRASGLVATTAPTAYLFTSEGVFLLRESDDGTFREAGLICRHKLADKDTLRTFGTFITFTDTKGNCIKIEGTKVSVISATSVAKPGEKISLSTNGGNIELTTRPLKLDSPERIKHLLSVGVRGNFHHQDMKLRLEGSHDLIQWFTIATTAGREISSLWSAAFPFFRLSISGTLQPSDTLSALAVRFNYSKGSF